MQAQILMNSSPVRLMSQSNLTADSTQIRKPRFQRQNNKEKCQCRSVSKSRLSCDSLSLQRLYVKKSTFKYPATQRIQQLYNRISSPTVLDHNQSQIVRTEKPGADIQPLKNNEKCNENKQQIQLNDSANVMKDKLQDSLKGNIFYKQKCQKYECQIENMTKINQSLNAKLKLAEEENQYLKIQIEKLQRLVNQNASHQMQQSIPLKAKPKINNLTKLKQQYVNIREQQQLIKDISGFNTFEIHKKIRDLKDQNEKLKKDIDNQNELFNLKLKMMQEKQEFLQKNLIFTKNTLTQLQKDYTQKQMQIFQNKRLNEIINQKNQLLETYKSKYDKLLKIFNGEKKRAQNLKSSNKEKINLPCSPRSKNHFQRKSLTYDQKQNKSQNSIKTNQKRDEQTKLQKIINRNIKSKQNYRISSLKYEIKASSENKNEQSGQLKRSNSQLTLSSFNSLELSPQK